MKWQIPAVFGTRSGTPTALGTRRFGLIEVQEGNNPGQFTAIGCGGINGDLHIVGIANYTDVWHTIRHADGSWQPAFGGVGSDQQGFPAVDCAGVGHDLHVVAIDGIDNGGPIWHTVRNADGTWQSGFDTVAGSLSFNYVACAGVGDELQVVGITSGGQLWHTIRHADGTWQEPFGLIQSQEANDPGHFLSVSCAGVGDELHLVGVAGGQLWHTIRNADGTWQPSFGLVETQETNNPGAFGSAGCAGVGQTLQLVGVDPGGKLWHTTRDATGTWRPAFGSIEGQESNDPGPFLRATCASVGGELQVGSLLRPTVGFL